MKRIALVFIALAVPAVLSIAAGCSGTSARFANSSSSAFRQISQSEAQSMMERETGYIILDVRTQKEFARGHIPNAVNIPVEAIGDQPPAGLPDKNQLVMVYCRSGNRSKKAASKLAQMGYANVVEFGGLNTWPGEVVKE